MPPLQRFVIALTGGLQDSKSLPDPSDLVELRNFALFRGRFALRAPVAQIAQITDEERIIDIGVHNSDVWILTWSGADDHVNLYSMTFPTPTTDWGTPTWEKLIYTGVTTQPNLLLTSFGGGSADLPESRLYISDYEQALNTCYYVSTTDTLTTLQQDFDADDSLETAYFSLMKPYQFHLWATGFYTEYGTGGDALRPEMLRFSQPGLISGTDPAGGTNPKEWFTFNHRSVGRRGDKIRALSYASGNFMVFQANSTHAVFGYGQDSWATKQLSDHVGSVGPRAATATDTGGLCFFWSHDGPFVTDGSSLKPIGEDIRQHVIDAEASEKVSVAYSPDDGMVYFMLHPKDEDVDGADIWPEYYLAYDTQRNRWCDGAWTDGSGTAANLFAIGISAATTASPRDISKAPGPANPPILTSIEAIGHEEVHLTWTRGDHADDVRTYVYKSTTVGFTPSATNQVGSWIQNTEPTEMWDQTCEPRTRYFYKLRHWRNGEYSASSNELTVRTGVEPPLEVMAQSRATGCYLSYEVPNTYDGSTAQGEIKRHTGPGGYDTLEEWREREPEEVLEWNFLTIQTGLSAGPQSYTDTGQDVSLELGQTYVYSVNLIIDGKSSIKVYSNDVVAGQGTGMTLDAVPDGLTNGSPDSVQIGGIRRLTFPVQYLNAEGQHNRIAVFLDLGSGFSDTEVIALTPGVGDGLVYYRYETTCPLAVDKLKVRFEAQYFAGYWDPDIKKIIKRWVTTSTLTSSNNGAYWVPCTDQLY